MGLGLADLAGRAEAPSDHRHQYRVGQGSMQRTFTVFVCPAVTVAVAEQLGAAEARRVYVPAGSVKRWVPPAGTR